ncbi:MAG: hypothetical protein NPIRA05_19320 [Nitrospirales bacterium]|nr:MAG: hypothetical protein NPIRA05_19320 [Nitrospirales bacterium]
MKTTNVLGQLKKFAGIGLLCFSCLLALPANADERLVTTIDPHENTAAYLKALKPLMARLQALNPDAEAEVLMGTFAGTSSGLIYVVVSSETIAGVGAITEKTNNDAEFQRLLAAVAATGRTIVSRSLLSEVDLD